MPETGSLQELKHPIIERFPELTSAHFELLSEGWDCLALDVDDRLIFKFPRHEEARQRLIAEVDLLAAVRPALSLPVPVPRLCYGPPLFSCHEKIPGAHLVTAQYEGLDEPARQTLARDMARFFAELHGLDAGHMEAVGAGPIEPWSAPEDILRRTWPLLPEALRGPAEEILRAWQDLPSDPHGITYGFFDGHGWNMAFDHARGRLNGIYDFGDSGFGPLHQEFLAPSFVAHDLTLRIVDAYEQLTGRKLDRRRIDLLTGAHRLSELAEQADNPAEQPMLLAYFADWMRGADWMQGLPRLD